MKFVIIAVTIIAAFVIFTLHRAENSRAVLSDSPRPVLRQFNDLRSQDFDAHPVWVHCHSIDYEEPWYEETDEETFRPWGKDLPVDPAKAMFLVKATFTFSDGTQMFGFITPQNTNDSVGHPDLGLIQPHVFLPDGKRVGFWFGILTPAQEEISSFYSAIGKSHQDVFPIGFEAYEYFATGITSGSIPGFCSIGESGEIEVAK